jgi:hypothetical protein
MAHCRTALLGLGALLGSGCFAPAVRSLRMAEPGQVVAVLGAQGPDVSVAQSGAGARPQGLVEGSASLAVGIVRGFQLEGEATGDYVGNWSAGGGLRLGFPAGDGNQMQLALDYDHGDQFAEGWETGRPNVTEGLVWDRGTLQLAFVHHERNSWITTGGWLSLEGQYDRHTSLGDFWEPGVALGAQVEIGPPGRYFVHWAFVVAGILGDTFTTGADPDGYALSYADIQIGLVLRFN